MNFERGKDTKIVAGIGIKYMANKIFNEMNQMNQKLPGSWTVMEETKPGFIECWIHNSNRIAGLIYVEEVKKKYPDLWDMYTYPPTKYLDYMIYYDNSMFEISEKRGRIGLVSIEHWLNDKNFEI